LSLQRFQSVRAVRRSRPEPTGPDQAAQVGPAQGHPASAADTTPLVEVPAKTLEPATAPWRSMLAKMMAKWHGAPARLSRLGHDWKRRG
jgi:hypothetical protein